MSSPAQGRLFSLYPDPTESPLFPLPIFVTGHGGMVGSAVLRQLAAMGIPGQQVITVNRPLLDLRDQSRVDEFFAVHRPRTVLGAAAKVGGILANSRYPGEFLYDNLLLATNTIQAAFRHGTERFLFLGSTCVYPRDCPQPIREEYLLTAPLEATNEAYALAKIAGLKLCQYYRQQFGVVFHTAMPTNLYGPGDNFHPENSHVLPALVSRFCEAALTGAPEVTIWGTGKPRREFLHADDLASALVHLLQVEDPPDWINVGTGKEIEILELAHLIAEIVGYRGRITTDPAKPDGTPGKRTDISRISDLGWKPRIGLREGIEGFILDYKRQAAGQADRS